MSIITLKQIPARDHINKNKQNSTFKNATLEKKILGNIIKLL